MAPEQVEGREADTRSDIWAFGAVLYEMLTGQQAFVGESSAAVIGAILKDRPLTLAGRRPDVAATLDHIVARCLEKDPDERWQSASDVKRELMWATTPGAAAVVAVHRRTPLVVSAVVGAVLVAAIGFLAWPWPAGRSPVAAAERTTLAIAPTEGIRMSGGAAISPDGRSFVYVGLGAETAPSLWLYSIQSGTSRELPGTDDASYPFWSPRRDAVGFFAGGQMKTVSLSGAPPRVIAPASSGRGGAWGEDGLIRYAPVSNGALYQVAEQGGAPALVFPMERGQGTSGNRFPTLVDARHIVYEVQASPSKAGIYLWSADTQSSTRLTTAYSNTAFRDGTLYYVDNSMLVARNLDISGARFSSEAMEVAGPVDQAGIGSGFYRFSVSKAGALTYGPGTRAAGYIRQRWVDRQGLPVGEFLNGTEVARLATYGLRISPDDRRVAFNAVAVTTNDVWLADIDRNVATRFTTDEANEQYPVWSPDGSELLFASDRTGFYNLYRKPTSGTAPERIVASAARNQYPSDWSRDGTIVFTSLDPKTQADIWTMPADGKGEPSPFLNSRATELSGRLSPDGHWMAYVSDESGRFEVYVQRFPAGGDKTQVSTQGGSEPQWRGDGRELFYVGANHALMAVPIDRGATLSAGRPSRLFQSPLVDTILGSFGQTHFTSTVNGQRFLINVSPDTTLPMMIVQNWAAPHQQ